MISIKPYTPADKAALIDIFRSNQPLYFAEEEFPLFTDFLDQDTLQAHYDVLFDGSKQVACGGIALKDNDMVIMCWGMVHSGYHKKRIGDRLLQHRIEKSRNLFPGKKIVLRTAQHTWKFFEKSGFKLLYIEKDYWAKGMDLYYMELL